MADMTMEQFINMLNRAKNEVVSKVEQGVNECEEDLLNLSQNLAPLDEGFLRGSGSVDPARQQGNEVTGKVGYNTEYALRMHEDFYTPQVEGTGRKYLENPTYQNAQKYAEHIGSKANEVFE